MSVSSDRLLITPSVSYADSSLKREPINLDIIWSYKQFRICGAAFSICENLENFMQYLYSGLHTSIEVSMELCYNIF